MNCSTEQPVAAKRLIQKELSDVSNTSCISNIEMNLTNHLDNSTITNLIQTEDTNEEIMENVTDDKMTNNQTSPRIDDDAVGKYPVVLYTEPKPTYYWGKISKVFSNDGNSNVTDFEVNFL